MPCSSSAAQAPWSEPTMNPPPPKHGEPRPATRLPGVPVRPSAAEELDLLLKKAAMPSSSARKADGSVPVDPVEGLRRLVAAEIQPAVQRLAEKYAPSGVEISLDVTKFLAGGRELSLNLAHQAYRTRLDGTVTSDLIAFLETRHTPVCDGHLIRGPSLRIRGLTAAAFEEFVCQRLALLVKSMLHERA